MQQRITAPKEKCGVRASCKRIFSAAESVGACHSVQ